MSTTRARRGLVALSLVLALGGAVAVESHAVAGSSHQPGSSQAGRSWSK
ncbi:hypothetical protein CLV35_0145 [Motilibacter peucedani]|uniref:Uncharacterized protein n=1 Tax=Motilibacter peucedani TaxID=598650 RepID=A0A420XVJ2_9ACTN|nr:hypothetical protein [Motilibacter peucedani]RKS80679.1 hypothetical protein CLV35_0145 [Motilibacter peucedani]